MYDHVDGGRPEIRQRRNGHKQKYSRCSQAPDHLIFAACQSWSEMRQALRSRDRASPPAKRPGWSGSARAARRLKGQKPVVHGWAASGILRQGLKESDALDILWSLTGPDHYRLIVTERRWPAEKYEAWL